MAVTCSGPIMFCTFRETEYPVPSAFTLVNPRLTIQSHVLVDFVFLLTRTVFAYAALFGRFRETEYLGPRL